MRMAMILSTPMPPREGIGFYAWNLARFLTREGHQVHVITRGGFHKTTREIAEGITIWKPPYIPLYPFHVHLHGLFVNALIRKLEYSIDLFHVHTPLPPMIVTKRPVMLSFHSTMFYDVLDTQFSNLYTLLMKLQAPISVRLEIGNLKRANYINAISSRAAKALKNYYHQADDIQVVWNAVDTNFFKPGLNQVVKEGIVLYTGRLAPGKGLDDLIQAFLIINRKAVNAQLLIAGEGPLQRDLNKIIDSNNLGQNVKLLGHIFDRNQLVELYQTAAIFVLPSHHEGLPTAVLEAMACGLPVVATCVGGLPEIINNGLNGKLVVPSSPEQLAHAICELLEDQTLRTHLGLKARQTIEERFSWDRIGSNFIRQYETMLSRGNERQ
jgi:glycosyltransferase involved in cell wall biosynthesis